jgi:hypothetical protein
MNMNEIGFQGVTSYRKNDFAVIRLIAREQWPTDPLSNSQLLLHLADDFQLCYGPRPLLIFQARLVFRRYQTRIWVGTPTFQSRFYVFRISFTGMLWLYCHVFSVHRRVLDWWPNLLDSLIQRVTTLYSTLLSTYTHQCPQSRLHCRCLVAAFESLSSPSYGFLKRPRPQPPTSNSNGLQGLSPNSYLTNSLTQLLTNKLTQYNWLPLTVLLIISRHIPQRKHCSSVAVQCPLPSNGRCLVVCFATVA